MMESKIGALWRKEKKGNGPVAKGAIDFSRIPEEDKMRIHEAFVNSGKVYVTVWENRHTAGDKKPDLTITMDKPWNGNRNNQTSSAPVDDEVPF